ncbi:MAG: aspartate ammonia-lyase [Proteobacteria bacterium]|nr:aspartate ammonia-lyase [Pseudomonadota bacterium]
MKMRKERDSLGEMHVPSAAYYGIQTRRATENFPVSGRRAHPLFVKAYAMIKQAASLTLQDLGRLDELRSKAIVAACDEILEGKLADQFVVDVFQAGAGTSFNMNVNEVVANRALEILGRSKGDYKFLSPNDHVNMAQSTNDTFPTAMHLAALMLCQELEPNLKRLERALHQKGKEFHGVIKSGRTHLQDAVPVRLGDEFAAYGRAVGRATRQIKEQAKDLEELAIGGTAVGTGLNAPPGYREGVVRRLGETTGFRLREAADLREAMQSRLAISSLSGALRGLALELIRIANDLRLLSSGPTTGLAEIRLPPVQPGSSIMPGKVNPVILECLNMIAFQIVGNDLTIAMAAQAGQMELNVMMPVMIHNLLESMEILKNFLPPLVERCIEGIGVNTERCRSYLEKNPALATTLNPRIGYLKAAEVAKESIKRGVSIRELTKEKGLLSDEEVDAILDPSVLVDPDE